MRCALALMSMMVLAPAAQAASCVTSPPPSSWSQQGPSVAAPLPVDGKKIGPLTIVMVRHAEKPLTPAGTMIEDGNLGVYGIRRAARLPARLTQLYGCPDLIVSTNPAVKIHNHVTGQFFNYVRPLATIAPFAGTIQFPVWTPYGFDQPDRLVRDMLSDQAFAPKPKGAPRTIIVAWEHHNIVRMTEEILKQGQFKRVEGTMRNGNRTWTCQPQPAWPECDFDSIWVVNIKDGQACFTRQYQRLNSPGFQRLCKGDVKRTP